MSIFNELSHKQILSYQQSHARINIWQGAVRSGKTYISIYRFLAEVANNPPGEYAIISRTFDTFKRNILSQIEKILPNFDCRYYSGKRELHIYGSVIYVIGADDESAETKIRGATFNGAYVDEATIIPESVFEMLKSRCAIGGAKIFVTTNPDSPFHWLYRNYLENNSDVQTWKFTLDDNPKLAHEDKEYLKRQYKGLYYQRFIAGLWVQAQGAVYDMFDSQWHVIQFPLSLATFYIVGIDYGTTNPTAFTLIGFNTDHYPNMWVEDEYYYDSKVRQRQKTDGEYVDDLKKFIANKNIKAIYVDPSAASFNAELRKQGVYNIFEAKNDVLDGIRFVQELMNKGALKITQKCVNLIKEFQSYIWDAKSAKTGIDKPLKENDHLLDSLRYACFTHLFKKNIVTTSAEDIDRLYKETRNGGNDLPRWFQDPH